MQNIADSSISLVCQCGGFSRKGTSGSVLAHFERHLLACPQLEVDPFKKKKGSRKQKGKRQRSMAVDQPVSIPKILPG